MKPIVINADCIAGMRDYLADNSVDAIVTDPPYGIGFMGKAWDGADISKRHTDRVAYASHDPAAGPNGGHKSAAAAAGLYDLSPLAMRAFQEFSREWAAEAFRVLKPGGHLLSFASARTYHRMAAGVEDAGFEIRDQIMWLYGSGFPKSHNLKDEWDGWGTALKPAHEPIVVARKPLTGTVAANVLAHGTGALNIDGCRVPAELMPPNTGAGGMPRRSTDETRGPGDVTQPHELGRWPANVVHDGSDEVLAAFPNAPGQMADASTSDTQRAGQNVYGQMRRVAGSENVGAVGFKMKPGARRLDVGSAARFFYCAKASKSDRNAGCEHLTPATTSDGRTVAADNAYQRGKTERANTHPTVKPTELMRYLCRLVTPPGGLVLDPFTGSGSTGRAATLEGFRFMGFELSPEYCEIARARIAETSA